MVVLHISFFLNILAGWGKRGDRLPTKDNISPSTVSGRCLLWVSFAMVLDYISVWFGTFFCLGMILVDVCLVWGLLSG